MRPFLSLLLIFLISCTSSPITDKDALLGSWRLQDITSESAKDDFEKSALLKSQVKDGMLFNFFEDGTYTKVEGNGEYASGKWTREEKETIRLKSANGKLTECTVQIRELPKGRLQLTLENSKSDAALQLIKEAEPLDNATQDPFHASNNQWRIKAKHQETDPEINNRMANYVKHFATILKAATIRKQEVVYFDFSIGPIKVYNSGIGIHPYELLPASWKNSFYNEADATIAYEVYKTVVRTNSYKGAATGNWMEDDYNILQSIYVDMVKAKP